jgi:hypothetical protein
LDTGNAATAGVLGGGLSALAALSVLLLLLLLKKKKKPLEQPAELTEEMDTMDEGAEYISEYGLSDVVLSAAESEGTGDEPRSLEDGLAVDDPLDGMSEHNPTDFGDFGSQDE